MFNLLFRCACAHLSVYEVRTKCVMSRMKHCCHLRLNVIRCHCYCCDTTIVSPSKCFYRVLLIYMCYKSHSCCWTRETCVWHCAVNRGCVDTADWSHNSPGKGRSVLLIFGLTGFRAVLCVGTNKTCFCTCCK